MGSVLSVVSETISCVRNCVRKLWRKVTGRKGLAVAVLSDPYREDIIQVIAEYAERYDTLRGLNHLDQYEMLWSLGIIDPQRLPFSIFERHVSSPHGSLN
jgi:hypothetical protein